MYMDLDINDLQKLKKEEAMLLVRKATTNIKGRFGQSNQDILKEEIQSKTIGLVTREEFKRKNNDRIYLELKQKRKQEQKLKTILLSYDQEQQEINEKRNYGKDNSVDTLYLPEKKENLTVHQNIHSYVYFDLIRYQMNIRKIWNCRRIDLLTLNFNIVMLNLYSNFENRKKRHQSKNFWNWQERRLQEISDLYELNTKFIQLIEFSPDDLLLQPKIIFYLINLVFHGIIAYKVRNLSEKPIFSFEQSKKCVGSDQRNEFEVEVENSTICTFIEKFRYEKIKHIFDYYKQLLILISTNENYDV